MDSAVLIVHQAVTTNQKILIIGDYDVDGATATTVAVRGLRALGARSVDYLVPNRFEYGYGLTPGIAEIAKQRKPNLVVTVDNGINAIQGVEVLRKAGILVLITDHHTAGVDLPNANAIINPNQPECHFPSKALAGVGVIFYLLLAVRTYFRQIGWFEKAGMVEPNLAELLDLVALGTIADMVPLDYNNRILVAQGLARIRAGCCCHGVAALINVAGKNYANVRTSDISFGVAPRINAAGRMADMTIGIECLLADNSKDAAQYSHKLDEINNERRGVEKSMQQEAMQIIANLKPLKRTDKQASLCLFKPTWHPGIVGLIASRVKEKFDCPVIAFAPSDEGFLQGSGRSVDGLHICNLLISIAIRYPDLLKKFGGHAMAVGVTIRTKDLKALERCFNEAVITHFSNRVTCNEILTDGELTAEEYRLETAELLQFASPWGQQFPEPLFDGLFEVIWQKIVGQQHLRMTLRPVDSVQTVNAIFFRHHVEPGIDTCVAKMIRAAYQLSVNEFNGVRSLQLLIKEVQEVDSPN